MLEMIMSYVIMSILFGFILILFIGIFFPIMKHLTKDKI